MTIEQSHGKARPTLPRASDLQPGAERDPSAGRGVAGRFAKDNTHGAGRGVKHDAAQLVGPDRRAQRLYHSILRELPSAGILVRLQVVELVHAKLAGAELRKAAMAAGIATPEGATLDERATKQGERAERLAVTCSDLARAQSKKKKPVPSSWGAPTPVVGLTPRGDT